MKKVAVILGSDSDLPVAERAFGVLRSLRIPFAAHVMSAHRSPDAVASFARSAREEGFGAIIALAGKAAHLAGSRSGPPTWGGWTRCSRPSRCRRASRSPRWP